MVILPNRACLGLALTAVVGVAGAFLPGCASEKAAEIPHFAANELAAPTPAFLAGPACLLLTNLPPFRAHVHFEQTPGRGPVEGELFGHHEKLLFARRPLQIEGSTEALGVAYILDISRGRGWLLSDALQGFAPLTITNSATNLVELPVGPETDVEGFRCRTSRATVALSEGYSVSFQLSRAEVFKGFPVRITVVSNAIPANLTFTKVRLENPPADLFEPPRGFTVYPSASAMLNECLKRQFKQVYSSP
jgi:hypothetical protein